MRISVEEYHIKNGWRGSLCYCPYALAVGPRLPAGWDCQVIASSRDQTTLYIYKANGQQLSVPLPPESHERIRIFDETGVMKPHEFEIEIPV